MASAPREDNRVPGLVAKSDVDNTPVIIEADPATKRLKVSAIITSGGGGSSGTQYTDGDAAITHPIGTIPVFNNAGTIAAVSNTNPLPVSATISTAGLATSTKQSDGSQKTQIVDGSGNVIGATSNALDINIKSGNPTSLTSNQGTAAAIGSGWPVIGGELADTTGTFTNATQTTSVTSSSFDGYSTVIVSINGTYNTASGVFEISDDGGTTWYSVNAARTDGSAIETGYTSLTNTNRMWTLSVSGADEFRVRSTAVTSGTANMRLSIESMPTPEAASVSIPGTVAVTESGTWNVGSSSATGSAVPANAFYIGINGASGNLVGMVGASTISDGNTGSTYPMLGNADWNGASWDRQRTVSNATNSVGTGITASGIIAQFDDVSPTAITENQFGNVRISANRNLYNTIRDAAGNERGVNVNASNQLSVSVDNSNISANVAQINGVTPLMGNGVTGTGSQRVTVASDNTPFAVKIDQTTPGTTNLVALAANQSVNLAQLAGNTLSSGVGTSGTGTLRTVTANDAGRILVSAGGSAASNGNNTLVSAGTNRLKVFAFSLSTTSTTAMTCIFQSGASGTELWRVILQAPTSVSTGANLVVQPPAWLFATATATLLNLNLSSANAVHWSCSYWDEA